MLHHWTTLLKSSDQVPEHASPSIGGLVRHVNDLALTLIQVETSLGVGSTSVILGFYEQFARLVTDEKLRHFIRIELPPSALIYSIFFSDSVSDLSRLSYILACYKRGFETAMATRTRSDNTFQIDALSYDKAYVNLYNGFLMDLCNCLWRSRAFSTAESNSHGCLVPRSNVDRFASYITSVDRSFSLASIFGLSYSPTLCYQSILRVRELEDEQLAGGVSIRTRHAGPVTQASLNKLATSGGMKLAWQEYRIGVLNSLTEKSLPGVPELLKCTMTVLRNAMEGR